MNLIPKKATGEFNGNYFCTWCFQGAAEGMCEERMFGKEGLISTYPEDLRQEVIVVFDDGWDIPFGTRNPEEIYRYGVGYPDPKRFPSTQGMEPQEALKWLVDKTKSYGFLGAGFWIPMQTSRQTDVMYDMNDYVAHWTERAKWADYAGVSYWKADWGQHFWNNAEARENLTKIVKQYAPGLQIEHAHVLGSLDREFSQETRRERECREKHVLRVFDVSDFYRTYDCGGVMQIPTTLKRLSTLMKIAPMIHTDNGCRHIVNVEDDVFIGASFGCSMGIMRHPLLRKENVLETYRALNWQHIMPPFALAKAGNEIDNELISNESFNPKSDDGFETVQSAPGRLSRNCPLAEVSLQIGQYQPWVLCAVHPTEECLAVYATPRSVKNWANCWAYADVTVQAKNAEKPVGIFGEYQSLTIVFPQIIDGKRIFVQDLADDTATDVSDEVKHTGNQITFTRAQIATYGNRIQKEGDNSAPAFVMQLV